MKNEYNGDGEFLEAYSGISNKPLDRKLHPSEDGFEVYVLGNEWYILVYLGHESMVIKSETINNISFKILDIDIKNYIRRSRI